MASPTTASLLTSAAASWPYFQLGSHVQRLGAADPPDQQGPPSLEVNPGVTCVVAPIGW